MDFMQELHQEAAQLGVPITYEQLAQYTVFANELVAWSEHTNLTAIREPVDIRRKHFLDSLSCVLAWEDDPPASLIDIGTGAGFPGLVLKVRYPEMRLTLVDSVGKKTAFLSHMVELLGMQGVTVLTARAEEVGQDAAHREAYECAVGRAVARLPILAEYLLPLVEVDGFMLAQKGETTFTEVDDAVNAIRKLGGGEALITPVDLPGVHDERYLILVEKERTTGKEYPRRVGLPKQRPLD